MDNSYNYNICNNITNNRLQIVKEADIKVNIADFKNKAIMSIAKAINEGDKNGYDNIMLNDSSLCGRISAKMVYVYPPGIPILCPGEIISENVVNIINTAIDNGLEVVGIEYQHVYEFNNNDSLNSLKNNIKDCSEDNYDNKDDKNKKQERYKGALACLK